MNRLITPSADTMATSEPLSLRQELIKADQVQQQRFELALRLGSTQPKASGPQERLGKPNESRRSTPDDDLAGRQGAAEERRLAQKRQARQAPQSKEPSDLLEGSDRQEAQPLPAASPSTGAGNTAPVAQQGSEDAQETRLPRDIASDATSPVAAEPGAQKQPYVQAPALQVESQPPTESDTLPERGELASLRCVEPTPPKEEPLESAPISDEEVPPEGGRFVGSVIRVPPLTVTPGDLLLARVAPSSDYHELGQLLSRLAVDIQLEVGRPDRPPLLQLTLPALGDLAIRIEHHQGALQVEILASEQGQLLLNQGRSELIDRLQRLYPGERVAFDLFTRGDSEQGSRQKRSIYDEWDADA